MEYTVNQIGMLTWVDLSLHFSNRYEKNAFKWADAVTAGSQRKHLNYYSQIKVQKSITLFQMQLISTHYHLDSRSKDTTNK